MTPEQIESTFEFILTQQAQFSVNQENLSSDLHSLTRDVKSLSSTVHILADATLNLWNIVQKESQEAQDNITRLDKIIDLQSRRLDRLERDSPL